MHCSAIEEPVWPLVRTGFAMPPFSRGANPLVFQLRARGFSSCCKSLSQLSKPVPKHPPRNKPTKVGIRNTSRPNPSSKTSSSQEKLSKLNPRYSIYLLRDSIAQSSATFASQVRKQYLRLPQPVRYTTNFIYLLSIVVALILPPAIIFRNHFFDIIKVTGPSMSPYLNTHFEDGGADLRDITRSTDRILLDLGSPRKNLRRGMIVAFRTPHDPEKWAIKRIVALQGDRVFPLPHYPDYEKLRGKGLIVPFGHMWLEGDISDANKKDSSMDSNVYGPVSTGLLVGQATHVITSFFSRWTAIDFEHFKLPERVQIDAVTLRNPDEEYQSKEFEAMFQNGKAAEVLEALKRVTHEDGSIEKCRENPDMMDMFRTLRAEVNRQLSVHDSETKQLATSLKAVVDEILKE